MLTHVCGTNSHNWWAKGLPGVGVVKIFCDSDSLGWKSFRLLDSDSDSTALVLIRQFSKNCSPIQSCSGQNWLQSWSSPTQSWSVLIYGVLRHRWSPPGFRLNIRQDSEFATGYGYPKTAFKREPDIRNGFIDISRIQTLKLHIAQSFIQYLQKNLFSLLFQDSQSVYGVTILIC